MPSPSMIMSKGSLAIFWSNGPMGNAHAHRSRPCARAGPEHPGGTHCPTEGVVSGVRAFI